MKVSKKVYAFVGPSTPKEVRLMAAGGLEELSPAERLTSLFILSYDKDEEVKRTARENFAGFPHRELLRALLEPVEPVVLKKLVHLHRGEDAVLKLIMVNPSATREVFEEVVKVASEGFIEELKKEESLIAQNPHLKEFLDECCPSKTERAEKEGTEEPTPEEEVTTGSIQQQISRMTVAEKIKLALTGGKEAREVLIKDSNKMVSMSVLKNPRITEDEVIKLTASKSASDELLREVARNREWLKNYRIKYNLVTNPKTPLHISMRLMGHLLEKDLQKLAKSKNIPSALAVAAKKALEGKQKR